VAAWAVVGGGDVLDAVGVVAELVALAEGAARLVIGIVNGDGLSAVTAHDGEAGDVGRAVADVNHVGERNAALRFGHVVVDVVIGFQHAFVDAEKVLRFRRVADDLFREADLAGFVLREFAAEDSFDVIFQIAAIEKRLEAGGNDVVVLDADAKGFVSGSKQTADVTVDDQRKM